MAVDLPVPRNVTNSIKGKWLEVLSIAKARIIMIMYHFPSKHFQLPARAVYNYDGTNSACWRQ